MLQTLICNLLLNKNADPTGGYREMVKKVVAMLFGCLLQTRRPKKVHLCFESKIPKLAVQMKPALRHCSHWMVRKCYFRKLRIFLGVQSRI